MQLACAWINPAQLAALGAPVPPSANQPILQVWIRSSDVSIDSFAVTVIADEPSSGHGQFGDIAVSDAAGALFWRGSYSGLVARNPDSAEQTIASFPSPRRTVRALHVEGKKTVESVDY